MQRLEYQDKTFHVRLSLAINHPELSENSLKSMSVPSIFYAWVTVPQKNDSHAGMAIIFALMRKNVIAKSARMGQLSR